MSQLPFARFLLPLVGGILFYKFIPLPINVLILGLFALMVMVFSVFIPEKYFYPTRLIFGYGLILFLFSLSVQFCQYRASLIDYDFTSKKTSYIVEILDYPVAKKRSDACEIQIKYPINKKIIAYLEPHSNNNHLAPGDLVLIRTLVKPFKNFDTPNAFDYENYMQNKGFSGTAYLRSFDWFKTGEQSRSLKALALRIRTKILSCLQSLQLDREQASFLSALTLGYKADLSTEVRQAFSTSGVSHILAVSGLHVGIIYSIVVFLFSFFNKRRSFFAITQILIIISLWCYVFITGMSISVMRAAIMLTLVCFGKLINRDGFTLNTLLIAAFFLLLINPFSLFDVGFQLSFICVFSIIFFQPKIASLYTPNNKVVHYIWSLFTVTLAAQIGAFPLVLYYFGTFPTYFFITNLLVIPLIGLVMYSAIVLVFLSPFLLFNIRFIDTLFQWVENVVGFLINVVMRVVYFFQSLPMASIEGIDITILQLFLIFVCLFLLTHFLMQQRMISLISLLTSVILLLLTNTFSYINREPDRLVVSDGRNGVDITYIVNDNYIPLSFASNQVISHPSSNIVLLSENLYEAKTSKQKLAVDYLILTSDNTFSMKQLLKIYNPQNVVVDSSISKYTSQKICDECSNLNIPFYDISELGALSLFF